MFFSHRRILSLPVSPGSLSFQSSRKGTPTYSLFPHLFIVAPVERVILVSRNLIFSVSELSQVPGEFVLIALSFEQRVSSRRQPVHIFIGVSSRIVPCVGYVKQVTVWIITKLCQTVYRIRYFRYSVERVVFVERCISQGICLQ